MSLSVSDFPSSGPPRTPIGKSIRRRISKACRQCQKDKKSCAHLSQDAKCARCEQLGHACDFQLQSQVDSQTSRTVLTKSYARTEVDNSGISSFGSTAMPSRPQSLQHRRDVTHLLRGRPIVAPEQGFMDTATVAALHERVDQAHNSSGQIQAGDRPNMLTKGTTQTAASAHSRQDRTDYVRHSLNEFGDMCATQEMILFVLKFVLVIVRNWVGNTDPVQACQEALQEALSHLTQKAHSNYKRVCLILQEDAGAVKFDALKHLSCLVERWESADGHRLLSRNSEFNLHQGLMRSHNIKNKSSRRIDYSVAFQMICTKILLLEAGTAANAENDANDLQETSTAISGVIGGLPLTDRRHRDILGGKVNAANDAWHQGEPQFDASGASLAVLRAPWLAQRLLNILPSTFFMGLSPFHLMLYLAWDNGFDTLLETSQIKMYLHDRDSFGMTLTLIAACKDDVTRFMRLSLLADGSGVDAVDSKGRNVLSLAARNNCQKIVSYILQQLSPILQAKLVTVQELIEALDAGNVDIAKMLILHYRDQPMVWTNCVILHTAQRLAAEKGYISLSTDIAALLIPHASAVEAVQSWNDRDIFDAQLASSSSNVGLHSPQVHQPFTTNIHGIFAREAVNGSIPYYEQATDTVYNMPSQSTDWSSPSQWHNTPSQDSLLFSPFGSYDEQSGESALPSFADFDNTQGSNLWMPP